MASTVTIPALVGAGTNLVLNFKAAEYHPESGASDWIDLDEEVVTYLLISIVESEES